MISPPPSADESAALTPDALIAAFRAGRITGPRGALEPSACLVTPRSILLMTPESVLKLRRPRRWLGLDLTTRTLRTWAVEQELWVGRRAAAHVYLGDASLHWDGADYALVSGLLRGEPLVAMRRLPDARRLDHLVLAGDLDAEALRPLLTALAAFHEEAPDDRSHAGWSAPDRVATRWRAALMALDDAPGDVLSPEGRAHLAAETAGWLEELADTLAHRVTEGRVRHLHGALRLDHLYLTDPIGVIDPLEGDDDAHWGDTAEDLAVTALELHAAGAPDLAAGALDLYAGLTFDRTLRYVTPLFRRLAAVRRAAEELALSREAANEAERDALYARARFFLTLA